MPMAASDAPMKMNAHSFLAQNGFQCREAERESGERQEEQQAERVAPTEPRAQQAGDEKRQRAGDGRRRPPECPAPGPAGAVVVGGDEHHGVGTGEAEQTGQRLGLVRLMPASWLTAMRAIAPPWSNAVTLKTPARAEDCPVSEPTMTNAAADQGMTASAVPTLVAGMPNSSNGPS